MGKTMQNLTPHLPWLVPLVSAIISGLIMGMITLHDMSTRLEKVENIQMSTSAKYIKKIDTIDWKVKHIEEFCCSELKEYDHYLERKAEHGLDSDTRN
jgi:hypothetical protein